MAFAGPVAHETGPNIVTNGGFENTAAVAGSGWTQRPGVHLRGLRLTSSTQIRPMLIVGTVRLPAGAIGGLGFISQSLATAVGASYNIHLWLANLSGFAGDTEVEVRWGGNVVYSATDIPGFGHTQIVIDPIATSANTVLSIGLGTIPSS